MELRKAFVEMTTEQLAGMLTEEEINALTEQPKHDTQGDLAFPCFALAKQFKKSPAVIALELAARMQHPLFDPIVSDGPYVNAFFDKGKVSSYILQKVLADGAAYGQLKTGEGKTVTLDFSSPNIAKPFSMGHLRSTVIGNALANIAEKNGYATVRINHLGDWGTQFGKLITAYKLWGSEEKVKQSPIQELLKLYVEFHERAANQPELEDEARKWFKQLEDGNAEAQALWNWFRDESLQEFGGIYEMLGIRFDSFAGEAFYNDKMEAAIDLLEQKQLLSRSEGADVVELTEYNLPPFLIRKSDGATLYGTRDLAAALYRQETYGFSRSLYVVGQEQSLHFKQLFHVLEKLGFGWANDMVHVPFGFILKDGKKMSTRKGKVALLQEVINEAIAMAEESIARKNPAIADKQKIARTVGIGAIIFHDLKNERMNNVEFSLEDMLAFEGATGPYVQYTHARACSILAKASGRASEGGSLALNDVYSWPAVKLLLAFPDVIGNSFEQNEPGQIARYLIALSQEFNSYYGRVKILGEDGEQAARLALVEAVTIVLKEGLRLLGVAAPEKM